MNDETLKEQIDTWIRQAYVNGSLDVNNPEPQGSDVCTELVWEAVLQDRERTVRDSISKRKLRDELSEASEEMLKPILNDELDPSERWEWYGYIRATRDIAEFAGVLNDSPIQARLKKALAQLSNPTQTKKTK